MKIQNSVKNSLKKIKDFHNQSKQSQQNNWTKQEVNSSLTLKTSATAPRLHQNYDYAMIKGNKTLKGLTAKFKGIVEEQKPYYALMQRNVDPQKFWGNEINTCLISQGFESPKHAQKFTTQSLQTTIKTNNKPNQKYIQKQTPPQKLSKTLEKKLNKYITATPIKEESIYSEIHPGKTTLPPIYPRKITHRVFLNSVN